jgi:Domain of unknown function (DUF4396)
MAPTWLTVIAWIYISLCFICAGVIAYDIVVRGRRQPMGVMNFVFPITALYFGPFALWLYWRWARTPAPVARGPARNGSGPARSTAAMPELVLAGPGHEMSPSRHRHAQGPMAAADPSNGGPASQPAEPERPYWATMAIEVSHCGSGCTLGDLISEWLIFAFAITVAGSTLLAEYVGDYVLAVTFGIAFQYFAIAPMRGLGLRDGLKAATKADVISLTFFEIGLFAWMALMAFVFFPRTESPDAELDRVLVDDATRHDHRLLQLLARERMARKARDQGANVSAEAISEGAAARLTRPDRGRGRGRYRV